MKKVVKCIRKGDRVEISNTIASKSAICKKYGAKWNPSTFIWTWESSTLNPSFDVDAFLAEYVSGPYNTGTDAAYWAHRKKADVANAKIEIAKDEWRPGVVPVDERSSEEARVAASSRERSWIGAEVYKLLCNLDRDYDDAFAYAYGALPCSCRTCVVNHRDVHYYCSGASWHTVGYIIGAKASVEELSRPRMDYHRYSWHPEPLVDLCTSGASDRRTLRVRDLEGGRAVVVFSIFDTSYE